MAAQESKSDVSVNPEFDKLLEVAEQLVSQKQLNPSLLISLGGTLAVEVNKVAGLRGSEKQQLVCDVVRQVVKRSVKATTDVSGVVVALPGSASPAADSLLFVVDHVLPASLDLAVAAARGKFDLKKAKKTCFSLAMVCLPSALGACGASPPQIELVLRQVEMAAGPDPVVASPSTPKAESPVPQAEKPTPHKQKNDTEVVEPHEVEATLPSGNQIA